MCSVDVHKSHTLHHGFMGSCLFCSDPTHLTWPIKTCSCVNTMRINAYSPHRTHDIRCNPRWVICNHKIRAYLSSESKNERFFQLCGRTFLETEELWESQLRIRQAPVQTNDFQVRFIAAFEVSDRVFRCAQVVCLHFAFSLSFREKDIMTDTRALAPAAETFYLCFRFTIFWKCVSARPRTRARVCVCKAVFVYFSASSPKSPWREPSYGQIIPVTWVRSMFTHTDNPTSWPLCIRTDPLPWCPQIRSQFNPHK